MDLCDHCGETIHFNHNCDRTQLENAVGCFKQNHSLSDNILPMALHVNYLYGLSEEAIKARGLSPKEAKADKKKKRDIKLKELLKKVTALRNSQSGYLIIQFVGLAPEDNLNGDFNEFVDDKLNEMIEDGSLFGDVFKKDSFKYHGERFFSLYVEGTSTVTTFDFQTKIALDKGFVTPSPTTLKNIVQKKRKFESEDFPPAHASFQDVCENRALQVKSTHMIKSGLVESVWEKLKLRECISAFSKNEEGGIYILGIEEAKPECKGKEYTSKKCVIHGMERSVCEEIRRHIIRESKESLITYDYEGNIMGDVEPIRVYITDITDNPDQKEKCLLQVAVQPVSGVVFYDKDGPLAYRIVQMQGSSITEKIQYPMWLRSFTRTN